MEFIYIYLAMFLHYVIWFIISQIKKNNGLIDIAWGLSFIVVAITSLLLSKTLTLTKMILNAVVLIWGLRLSSYLFVRNWHKEEDFRYQAMRKKWKDRIKLRSFVRIFVLQSIFAYMIALPITLLNLFGQNNLQFVNYLILGFGLALFVLGFTFEVLADYHLQAFKKDIANKGKILTTGVWKYTRHPNYFGEATLWWGIGIISISTLVPIIFVGIISPIFINLLLRYVSGVPLLEKKYQGNLAYEAYKEKTPIFLPIKKQSTK